MQLEDDTELMLYINTDQDGNPLMTDGSFVAADGSLTVLDRSDFMVEPTGAWTSGVTGVTYPSGWEITVPAIELHLALTPAMPNQELDTRATTGVIYWEGEVLVAGTRSGDQIAGLGYVELIGYANREPEKREDG